jgi:copper transport protein
MAEVAVAVVVLGLSAVLVNTEPAKVDYDPPYAATVVGRGNNGENITVRFDVARTKTGPTTMRIHTSSGGRPVPFTEVRGSLVERTKGLGPVEVIFTSTGAGDGSAAAVVVPEAGTWTLTAQIRTDETTDYSATTVYPVR